jgi:hypothetical protein
MSWAAHELAAIFAVVTERDESRSEFSCLCAMVGRTKLMMMEGYMGLL